jgi:outer membrane protein TolC
LGVFVVSVALSACAEHQFALSRAETDAILSDLSRGVESERREARAAQGPAAQVEREQPTVPDRLGIVDALRIAHGFNRGLRSDREGLVLSALTLVNARRNVGPRFTGSVTSLIRSAEHDERVRSSEAALGVLGLLPTGAEVSLPGTAGTSRGDEDPRSSAVDGAVTARISQPRLSGAGYEASHEFLTDAERQALYDVRDVELRRQDLALRVQRDFYGIVAQKTVVRNREATLAQFEFLKRRSETLFAVDRVSEVDKFRAAREALTAENSLVDARQELASRLDRFRVLLGIDPDVSIEVVDDIPEVTVEDVRLEDALEIALRNRIELMTARDQVDDAERRLRIRTQELLPQLRLVAERTRASRTGDRHLDSLAFGEDDYSAALELELPLDRVRERSALRAARVELSRNRRAQAELEDQVILSVRESLRDYRSSANSLAIQRQIVTSEEKNSKVARLRFENGEIGNRDLTDAQNNLVDAQDRLVRERVNVELARVQFLRDLGVLTLEEDGTWVR